MAALHSGWRFFLDLYMLGFTLEGNIQSGLIPTPKSMGIFFHHGLLTGCDGKGVTRRS